MILGAINVNIFSNAISILRNNHLKSYYIFFILETQRDIHQKTTDELLEAGLERLQLRYVAFLPVSFICKISTLFILS